MSAPCDAAADATYIYELDDASLNTMPPLRRFYACRAAIKRARQPPVTPAMMPPRLADARHDDYYRQREADIIKYSMEK